MRQMRIYQKATSFKKHVILCRQLKINIVKIKYLGYYNIHMKIYNIKNETSLFI